MRTTRSRRSYLWLELLAVFLVTALGIVTVKEGVEYHGSIDQMIGLPPEGVPRIWALATVPLFILWSLLVFALEFRSGGRRRAWRRPGIVPGVAVILFVARDVIHFVIMNLRMSPMTGSVIMSTFTLIGHSLSVLETVSHNVGFAVAATWLALWAGRWWRPAPTWVDRAGRALGCYWIAIWVVDPWYHSLL